MEIDDELLLLEANLDDQSPEELSPLLDLFLNAGVRDAYFTPIIMKKGRPALKLSLLFNKFKLAEIEELVFTHTSSFGFRITETTCHRLARHFEEVQTKYGPVKIKIGEYQGKRVSFAPEFEDCALLAKKSGQPLKVIFSEANHVYLSQQKES